MSTLKKLKFIASLVLSSVVIGLTLLATVSAATDLTLPSGSFFSNRDITIGGNFKTGVMTYDDKGITKAEVYVDGKFYMQTTDGFGFNFDTEKVEDGTYKVEVKLYDADGNTAYATSSDGYPYVNFIVAHGDIFLPSGTFGGINQNQTVNRTVALSVKAKDNKAVARVEFFADGKSLGVDTSAVDENYAFDWDTTTVSEGVHTVTANIFDTSGNFAWATSDGAQCLDIIVRNTTEVAAITTGQDATDEKAATKKTTVAPMIESKPAAQTNNAPIVRIAFACLIILAIMLVILYRFGVLKLIEVKLRAGMGRLG